MRSYAYILSLGADGLQEASEIAVLNANYLMARLAETAGEHLPPAYERTCMHEFVLTGGPMKKALGIRTLDLAKRLLDFGFHPPTVYFPLLVDEALLIEPTETETRETLDAFADAIGEILAEDAERRARRALHDAGPAARRGRRREAPGHPPAAVARNRASRSPSAAISPSWRGSIGANGRTSTRPSTSRHVATAKPSTSSVGSSAIRDG